MNSDFLNRLPDSIQEREFAEPPRLKPLERVESRLMVYCDQSLRALVQLRKDIVPNMAQTRPPAARLEELIASRADVLRVLLECADQLWDELPPKHQQNRWAVHVRLLLQFLFLLHHPHRDAWFVNLLWPAHFRIAECPVHPREPLVCACNDRTVYAQTPAGIVKTGSAPGTRGALGFHARLCKFLLPAFWL